MTKSLNGALFGMCNPLLDLIADVKSDILKKYNLKDNDQILADETHKGLFEDLLNQYKVQYVAGGAGQNSMRVAQWLLPPNSTVYLGCVGNDEFSRQLKQSASNDGLHVEYMIDSSNPTGCCAVLVQGKYRSLVANLAAANNYKMEHLLTEKCQTLMENAQCFYITGFFITVSPDSIIHVANHAAQKNKPFCFNLSAPFLSQFFNESLLKILPYVDVLFGNETEALAFAEANAFNTKDMKEIAIKLSALPKVNQNRNRIVVITQGADCVIVATKGNIQEFSVAPIPSDEIVDTNGAGDAFVGGFLSQFILGNPIEDCIQKGIYAASVIIRSSGCTFPKSNDKQ